MTKRLSASESSASSLVVRRLMVDLRQPLARHWNGGDAFRTAFANALSMSFPVGEQFFIEAVQKGLAALPAASISKEMHANTLGFMGQEATHRHLHGLFNAQLTAQGLRNHWEIRARARIASGRKLSQSQAKETQALNELAITSALEHFTAIFGEQTLRYQEGSGDWFLNADEPFRTLWQWHASEECEHKTIAFDLYEELGGSYRRRIFWFAYVVLIFLTDCVRQTTLNLWDDGRLMKPRTWWDGFLFLWGRHGAVWRCALPLMRYLRPHFHPSQEGNTQLAKKWLEAHANLWVKV